MSAALASPAQVWRAYQGSDAARSTEDAFVERHLGLVRAAVERMKIHLPPHADVDDLYSVGVIGLIKAARKYDPAQEKTFAAFATRHIRGAVLDELRRIDWLPRSTRAKARRLQETTARLEQSLGRAASGEEICHALSISAADYESLLEEVRPATFLELDSAAGEEDAGSIVLHETIEDENQPLASEQLDRKQLHALVAQRIAELPDMQKKVLALYYFEEMRVAEIAAAFDLTEGRISQIHTQAVLALRGFVERTLKEQRV